MLFDAAPWRWSRALLLVLLATAWWTGCSPDAFLVADEDRERNYQRARDAERLGDFEAAAEYYERALERNSRAAGVHLSYATLCEGRLQRYADAIYHYQRYLRLRPDDPKADDIRRRAAHCTERLATAVPLVIRSETIARDLAAIRNENLSLRAQVTNLHTASVYWSNEWRRAYASFAQASAQAQALAQAQAQAQAPAQGRSPGPNLGQSSSPGITPAPGGGTSRPNLAGAEARRLPAQSAATPPPARVHRVRPGETMDRISRHYGVTLRALQQANPTVSPRRMRAGMDLRLPPRTP